MAMKATAGALFAGGALLVAACGGSAQTTAQTTAKPASPSGALKISVKSGAGGTYLTDSSGRSLYLWVADSGGKSSCSGACAQAWPPLITRGKPKARGGAKQSMLSTSRRANGKRQVLYNGHPVYRYAFDSAPGDTNGEGLNAFGARWFAVAPSGRAMTSGSAPASPNPY